MRTEYSKWDDVRVLNAAIIAGMVAIFLAVATPLVRGALIRQRTAECARKVMQAAEAFDFYASAFGSYPQSQRDVRETEKTMRGVFAIYGIDWWAEATELGGQWGWATNGQAAAVVISGRRVSGRQMAMLDRLIDDGDLQTGVFQRRDSCYRYIIKGHML